MSVDERALKASAARTITAPHSADKRVLDVVAAHAPREVVHVQCPDHGAAKVVLLDPVHLVADGALVVEAHPLVALHQVRHLHLVVPHVRGLSRSQHFADLFTLELDNESLDS